MRSIRVASIVVASTVFSIVAVLACNPSSSSTPTPETPDMAATSATPADPEEGQPDMAPPSESDDSTEPGSATDTPPGDVDLPPPSASAWNTGQSDGQPGKADRGIKDYQRIIQENREKFRACYDAARAKHEGIKGRVTLVWVLDPKGTVKDGAHMDAAASDFEDAFLESCLVSKLKTVAFPPSRRGMDSTVTYPFTFNPRAH